MIKFYQETNLVGLFFIMRILLSEICNSNCSYCYSNVPIEKDKLINGTYYMSLDNLKIICDFLFKSGIYFPIITGGEPTINPNFNELFNYLCAFFPHILVESNGLIPNHVLTNIERKKNKSTLRIHIFEKDLYEKKQKNKLHEIFELLADQVSLSYTICQLKFDLTFMIDLINKYNLKREIYLSIAKNIPGNELKNNNKYLHVNAMDFAIKDASIFIKKAHENNIKITLDCGFTCCSFDKEYIEIIRLNNIESRFYCSPLFSVKPNLEVFPCVALLNENKYKITDFQNYSELNKHFQEHYFHLYNQSIYSNCDTCSYYEKAICAKGCGYSSNTKNERILMGNEFNSLDIDNL